MLTIFEIYASIQGESTHAGRPCTFVRLAACDLRCTWCDTSYAFTGGTRMTLAAVLDEVARLGQPVVEITGGEPLLQPEVVPLMQRLVERGHLVLLETGGHRSIAAVPPEVVKIVDVKCPASGEAGRQHWPNLDLLAPHDEVKFVVQDRADYEYARHVVTSRALATRCAAVHLSPVHGVLDPRTLAAWVLEDRLPVRVQLQLHKYIWDPATRGV